MNSSPSSRRIAIMGTRGIPAQHGGFETFAERLGPYLARCGWEVTVYCQEPDTLPIRESQWEGVRRVHIGVGGESPRHSMKFDWACISHVLKERPMLAFTMGYNTAVFALRLRAAGVMHVINMDGIEWAREKWGPLASAWLYANDWAGSLGGNHLVADHPMIARHLVSRVPKAKISTIPYGCDIVDQADAGLLKPLGLDPGGYLTLIARSEPENSVLEIVKAFSAKRRGLKLVVLGRYRPEVLPYHAEVMAAASPEVIFAGRNYDHAVVNALRRHCVLYMHGHRVGGTNPSLVEAMGASNPVLAHDNRFNRWVAREGAWYFHDAASCEQALDKLLDDPAERARMALCNRQRAQDAFSWSVVLSQYEVTLSALHARAVGTGSDEPLPYAGSLDTVNTVDLL